MGTVVIAKKVLVSILVMEQPRGLMLGLLSTNTNLRGFMIDPFFL